MSSKNYRANEWYASSYTRQLLHKIIPKNKLIIIMYAIALIINIWYTPTSVRIIKQLGYIIPCVIGWHCCYKSTQIIPSKVRNSFIRWSDPAMEFTLQWPKYYIANPVCMTSYHIITLIAHQIDNMLPNMRYDKQIVKIDNTPLIDKNIKISDTSSITPLYYNLPNNKSSLFDVICKLHKDINIDDLLPTILHLIQPNTSLIPTKPILQIHSIYTYNLLPTILYLNQPNTSLIHNIDMQPLPSILQQSITPQPLTPAIKQYTFKSTAQTKADHTSPTTTSKPIINDQQYKMDHEVPLICSAMMPKPKPPANNDDPSGPPDNNNVTPPPSGSNIPSEDVSHTRMDKDDNNTLHKTDDLRYDHDMRYLSILSVCLGMICPEGISELDRQGNQQVSVELQHGIECNGDTSQVINGINHNTSTGVLIPNSRNMTSDNIQRTTTDQKEINEVYVFCNDGNHSMYCMQCDYDHDKLRANSNSTARVLKFSADFNNKLDPTSAGNCDQWICGKHDIKFRSEDRSLLIIFFPITRFAEEMTQLNAQPISTNDQNLPAIKQKCTQLFEFLNKHCSDYSHKSPSPQSTATSSHESPDLKPIQPVDSVASSSTSVAHRPL